MADRYWVGGAGTWSNTSTTNWSATSGGASGATAPTTADNIFFDANSGATPFTVTVSATTPANCQNMTVSVGNITFGTGAGSQTVTINGNLDLHSQTTWSATSQVLLRTTGTQTTQINSNGVLINGQVTFFANGSGTINLASNLAVVNSQNIRLISNGGGIEGNGFWMTTAANLTSDGTVATTINNLRANTTYIFSGGSQTVTLGGTGDLPSFSYSSTNSLSISASANITIGNSWNISAITTRTLALGADSRVRLGASAASGSNVFVANAAANLTISQGSNDQVVVAYSGTSSNSINVFSFTTSFVEANSLNFSFPSGSHTLNLQGTFRDMDFTGFSGNLATIGTLVQAYGNVKFSSTMNTVPSGNWLRFASATTKTFDSGSIAVNVPVQVTGRMAFTSNLTLAANNTSNGWFSISGNATANLNGFNLTTSNLTFNSFSGEFANLDYGTGGNVNINNNQGGVVFSANTTGSQYVQNAANGNLNINLYTGNAATIYVGQPGIGYFNYKILSGSGNLTILPGTPLVNPVLGNIDFTGFTGNVNVAANTFFAGTVTLDPGLTVRNSGFYWIFSRDANIGLTSPNITTNGRVIDAPTRFGGNRTLQGNATLGTITGYVCEANSGILTLNNNALICNRFDGSNTAATKTIDFGTSGQIICTGNNTTVLNLPSTNVTLSGNVLINSNYSGAGGTRTVTLGNYAGTLNLAVSGGNINFGTGGTDTVTFTGNVFNFNLTGMNFTYNHTATGNIHGNFTVPATGGTFASTANTLTIYTPSGNTSTITVNRTIDLPVTFNGTGTYTLANNLTVGNIANNRTLTMNQGTFNFANFVVTTQNFSTTGSAVRALNFSTSGYIVLNPNTTTTSFNAATSTNLTVSGNAQVFSNSTSAFTRTILNSSPNISFTLNEPAGAATTISSIVNDLTVNAASAINNGALSIFGNLIITSTATVPAAGASTWTFASNTAGNRTITTNGKVIDWPLTFNGIGGNWVLNDALNMSNRTVTLTAGTLNVNNFTLTANSFSSSGTGVRSITFGTSAITLSGSSVNLIDIQNASNFTYSGTPYFNSTYTGATGQRNILLGNGTQGTFNDTTSFDISVTGSSGIIANTGTDSLNVLGHVGNLNLTGMQYANFINNTRFVYKNFTVPATGGNMQVGTLVTTLAGNGTQTVTVNRNLDFPVTVGNGTSQGNVVLANNLNIGATRTLTLTSGNLTFNGFTTTSNAFSSTGANSRTLAFGSSGNMLLTGNGVTIWDTTNAANFITTGTERVFANYNSNLGTRTVTFGNIAEAYTFNVKFASAVQADSFTILNTSNDAISISNNMRDFDFTSSNSNLNNTTRTVYGNFTIPATGGNIAIGTAVTTFAATSGNFTVDTTARTLQFPLTFNSTGGANYTIANNLVANSTTVLTLSGGNVNFNQRTLTFANITVLTGGNSSISNLSTTLPFVHTSGNLTILSGAINCATTNTYTLTSGILNVAAAFSTGAFTHTAGNIIL